MYDGGPPSDPRLLPFLAYDLEWNENCESRQDESLQDNSR
jgi:hypothetical protein